MLAVAAAVTAAPGASAGAGRDAATGDAGAARITYDAPAGCPDRDAFEAAVRERLPTARFATGTEPAARSFTIAIAATDDGYTGALTAGDGGAARRLAAHQCNDVVTALALITALAIDPSAAVSAVAPPPTTTPARPGPRRWHLAGLAGGALAGGVTPGALWIGAIGARLLRRGLGHLDLEVVAGGDRDRSDAGEARFTYLIGRGSACWLALPRRVEVDACAVVEAGALRARGVDVVRAQDLTRPYLAAGVAAAARWPRASRGFLELRAGVSFPLIRDRFVFTPNVLIHETAAATPWAGLGGGVRFW